jgi:hypothetical protein
MLLHHCSHVGLERSEVCSVVCDHDDFAIQLLDNALWLGERWWKVGDQSILS